MADENSNRERWLLQDKTNPDRIKPVVRCAYYVINLVQNNKTLRCIKLNIRNNGERNEI
jgi:hypothetical protein